MQASVSSINFETKQRMLQKLSSIRVFSFVAMIAMCIIWPGLWIFTGASSKSIFESYVPHFAVTTILTGILWFTIGLLVKRVPEYTALVDHRGEIIFDTSDVGVLVWHKDYSALLKQGRLVSYRRSLHKLETCVSGRKYTIYFFTGETFKESLELEAGLRRFKDGLVLTAEDLIKFHLYDVISEQHGVISGLKNPFRSEEQNLFRQMLDEHLLPKLTNAGVRVITRTAAFDWT